MEDQLLSEIGKYVVDEESKYLDGDGDGDEEEDENKTVKITEDLEKKYGIRVFETSALLGTGLDEVFTFVTEEILMQLITSDKSYAVNRAQTTLAIDKEYMDASVKHSNSVNMIQSASVKSIVDTYKNLDKLSKREEKDGYVDLT